MGTMSSTLALTRRACPVCGNSSRAFCHKVYTSPEFDVLRCQKCHVTFVDQVIDDNVGFSVEYTVGTDALACRKAADDFRRIKANLSSLGFPTPKGSRLLDIGCGIGSFLLHAQDQGWAVAGMELNPALAAWARENRGLEIKQGSIEGRSDFPGNSMDILTMFGVIEHLARPPEAVKECGRILRCGGMLILQTPSEDGLMRRAGRLMFRASRGRIKFHVKQFYQMGGGHSVCFNRRSIEVLLNWCGFEVLCIEQSTYGLKILIERFKSYQTLRRAVMIVGTATIFCLGRVLGLSNHMTVYARKNA